MIAALLWVLQPPGAEEMDVATRFAQYANSAGGRYGQQAAAILDLIQYRRGDFTSAHESSRRLLAEMKDETDDWDRFTRALIWPVVAMSASQSGDKEAARASLAEARRSFDAVDSDNSWMEFQVAQALLEEAEAVVGK